jgi:OOP family OmpA-OmpF porin
MFMRKIIIGSLLGLATLPVFAEEGAFSADILLGKTTQKVNSASDDATSIGIRGAYNINKNVALEASYQNYGEASWNSNDDFANQVDIGADTAAFNLGVKGILPLDDGFSLHARAGLSFWDVDIEVKNSFTPGVVYKGSDSGNDFYYGVGAQYSVNEKLSIGLEYTVAKYEVKPDGDLKGNDEDLELDTLALTVSFNF